ncbi:hypothetical protein EIP86_006650 [Pleurotus ostreatoroseus]|nr:hypothetical protein EIP86_006650 [Pleurotus ostreatoroseus]
MNNSNFNGQGSVFSGIDDVNHQVISEVLMQVPYRDVQEHPDFAGYSQIYPPNTKVFWIKEDGLAMCGKIKGFCLGVGGTLQAKVRSTECVIRQNQRRYKHTTHIVCALILFKGRGF